MTETESDSEMVMTMVMRRGLRSIPMYTWNHPGMTKSFIPIVLHHWLLLLSLTLTRPSAPPHQLPAQATLRLPSLPLISCPQLPELSETPQKTLHGVSNPRLFREGSFYCLSLDKISIPPEGTVFLAVLSNKDCSHPSPHSRTRRQRFQTAGSLLSWPQTSPLPFSQTHGYTAYLPNLSMSSLHLPPHAHPREIIHVPFYWASLFARLTGHLKLLIYYFLLQSSSNIHTDNT